MAFLPTANDREMDDYWSEARTSFRDCMQLAIHGKLDLPDYFNDKETMMKGCIKLGMWFRQQKRFEEAIEYHQLHLR